MIEWTDKTWNPVVGCSRISEGCRNCYAATVAQSARLQQFPRYREVKEWDGKVVFDKKQLEKPFSWRSPAKIFVCSMSDLFHEGADEYRDEIFAVMAANPRHTFQVLTKRPERALKYFQESGWANLDNIWFGASAENQRRLDERSLILKDIPVKIKWLSCEPLLGVLDLSNADIDWVVVGGESGRDRREMKIEWLESVVIQCRDRGTPVFVKQDTAFQSGKQGRIPDDLWGYKQFPVV